MALNVLAADQLHYQLFVHRGDGRKVEDVQALEGGGASGADSPSSLGSYWIKAKATRLPWCTPALADAECRLRIDPHENGFGIMRDAQTAKPQTFRTGDGWSAYNLAANLAQLQA